MRPSESKAKKELEAKIKADIEEFKRRGMSIQKTKQLSQEQTLRKLKVDLESSGALDQMKRIIG
jgi:hypothetical protein